jgi:hypothetical protein
VREHRFGSIPRTAAPAALLVLLCLSLSACGGSSTTTTSASAEAAHSGAAREKGDSATPKESPTARVAKLRPSPAEEISARLRAEAGRAAPFLLAGADNSIPTYGSQSSGSQQREAQATLIGYLRAWEAGQWGSACALMGKTVQRQLRVLAEGSGGRAPNCAAAFALLAKYNPSRKRANVLVGSLAAFRVKGDKGFALFYGPHHQQFMMPMVREAGRWKVSQSIPIPYPIGAPLRGGR